MKKFIACFLLSISLFGCANNNLAPDKTNLETISKIQLVEDEIKENKPSRLFHALAFEKENYDSVLMLYDDYLVYNALDKGDTKYFKYNFKSDELIELGAAKDYIISNTSRTLLDNRLYFYVVSGSVEDEITINNFYAIDLESNELIEVSSEEKHLRMLYVSSLDNEVVSLLGEYNHEEDIFTTYLEIYNPVENSSYRILENATNYNTGNGWNVLNLDCYDNKIYAFIEEMNDYEISYYINVYNTAGELINSINISDYDRFFEESETVGKMKVMGNYIFARNHSGFVFIGKMEDDKITPIINVDDKLAYSMDIAMGYYGNNDVDKYIFFQRFTDSIVILDKNTGEIHNINVEFGDIYDGLRNITVDEENNITIALYFNEDNRNSIEQPLYFLNLDDLLSGESIILN